MFLAVFSLIYGMSALISDKPFFVGSDSYKLKEIEWIYNKLGSGLTGMIFILFGLFLIKVSIDEFKTNKEGGELVNIFGVKIIVGISVLGVFILATLFSWLKYNLTTQSCVTANPPLRFGLAATHCNVNVCFIHAEDNSQGLQSLQSRQG